MLLLGLATTSGLLSLEVLHLLPPLQLALQLLLLEFPRGLLLLSHLSKFSKKKIDKSFNESLKTRSWKKEISKEKGERRRRRRKDEKGKEKTTWPESKQHPLDFLNKQTYFDGAAAGAATLPISCKGNHGWRGGGGVSLPGGGPSQQRKSWLRVPQEDDVPG